MDQAEADPDLPSKTSPEPAKPPTMEDVAARAGVSRALVSIVFRGLPGASPENRERVRRAAAELGFRPDRRASLLGSKRTNLLGVAFGVGHEFHADLISALYAAAAEHGLELVLSGVTAQRSEQQAIAELLDFRCDAVLVLGPTMSSTELAAYGSGSPVVVMARAVEAAGVEVIRTDDELGARLATEHLLSLGHRTIVHLDGGRAPRGRRAAPGLPADHAGGRPDGARSADSRRADRGRRCERRRAFPAERSGASRRRCSPSTTSARSVSCRRSGTPAYGFPADLSLVGYDDSRLAHASWTRLTTVGQDTAALADGAVSRALARIRPSERTGADRPLRPLLVPPSLVIRSTTARPEGAAGVPAARRL